MNNEKTKVTPPSDDLKKALYDHIAFLNGAKKGMNENLSKAIITFSIAILGFSVTIIKKLKASEYSTIIVIALASFFMAIAFMVMSYITGKKGIESQILDVKKNLDDIDHKYSTPKMALLHEKFQNIASMSFSLGLASFFIFIILELRM
ncbi:hypothetical protein [uncultured Pseudoteredinibacter sp.]|uniref:hypothetical protein n=1 Tax=uncultured Pseudoteredinibacter sp. TaxID=1641701 RepID=UPI00261B034A|nr:hypothetical protein [uncultured Pseudoteredinibacter sp.]